MKSKLKEKQQFYINFRILANNQKFFHDRIVAFQTNRVRAMNGQKP